MARDYSGYSISELQEALRAVDGNRYPANKAAIEAELQARKDSGEFAQEELNAKEAAREQAVAKLNFALKARVVIAWYLIVSPAIVLTGFSISAGSLAMQALTIFVGLVFVSTSVLAGIGLLKKKMWGHWAAVAVLGSQVLRIQSEAFVFNFLSSVGIYVYYAQGGDVGFDARFEPGFGLGFGTATTLWIGVNLFVVVLLNFLFTATEETE